MSVSELNTFHTICDAKGTQLATILARSLKNPQLACFLYTQNRSILYMSKAQLTGLIFVLISLLYKKLNISMIKALFTILTLSCMLTQSLANQIPCENNPQNVITLEPDTDQYNILTPQPSEKIVFYFLDLFKSKRLLAQTPFCPRCRYVFSKELKRFWNPVLFTKHSNYTL